MINPILEMAIQKSELWNFEIRIQKSEIWNQEPITWSLQLPHIPVTAFSQTDLFLVWIYREF